MNRPGLLGIKYLLIAIIGLLWTLAVCAEKLTIVHPHNSRPKDQPHYQIELLKLALSKAGAEFEMKMTPVKMLQGRALLQLANQQDINVAWAMTSKEREQDLLPIRIPIDKGLLGWRIFLIHQDKQADFSKVQTMAQLKSYVGVQGHDWPDTLILRANGFTTITQTTFHVMYSMLRSGQIDYFPRSINEIDLDLKAPAAAKLIIESDIALHYPAAQYFFVNRNNKALAEVIERGLRVAMKDGSFDKLFDQYHGEAIRRSNLKKRKIFHLTNPLLTAETPLQQKELWFQP